MSLEQSSPPFHSAFKTSLITIFIYIATTGIASASDKNPNPCDDLTSSSSDYKTTISILTRLQNHKNITQFMNSFDKHSYTIIFLHGGMGSELKQTIQPFDKSRDPIEYEFKSSELWLNYVQVLLGGSARQLRIDDQKRDYNSKIIIADSAVKAPLVKPYKKAQNCFRNQFKFNTYFLAWDTRRDLIVAVNELRSIVELIKREHSYYDLNNLFIVGHSFGGIVAKLFLETNQDLANEIGGMISVGTPFYGYLGQLNRIFNGEPLLNNKGPILNKYTAKEMAGIISSFPAFYTVLPIDAKTFEETWGQCKGQEDRPFWCQYWPKNYPFTYPVTDPQSQGNVVADAYRTAPDKYPGWVRKDMFEDGILKAALKLRRCLAKPFPECPETHPKCLKTKVHHIRSKISDSTPWIAEWNQKLPPNYDPDKHPSPIKIGRMGEGDGTIPYWSAALTSTPPNNIHDIDGPHMTLMTKNSVLRSIYNIVTDAPPSSQLSEEDVGVRCGDDLQPMATREELEEELKQLDNIYSAVKEQKTPPLFWLSRAAQWRLIQELAM